MVIITLTSIGFLIRVFIYLMADTIYEKNKSKKSEIRYFCMNLLTGVLFFKSVQYLNIKKGNLFFTIILLVPSFKIN